jgi:hypothetical protein
MLTAGELTALRAHCQLDCAEQVKDRVKKKVANTTLLFIITGVKDHVKVPLILPEKNAIITSLTCSLWGNQKHYPPLLHIKNFKNNPPLRPTSLQGNKSRRFFNASFFLQW